MLHIDRAGGSYCYPHECADSASLSGLNLDACEAVHGEQNALLQCRDVFAIDTAYVTTSPCLTCVKLLLNTSCQRIIFAEPYAHDAPARELWEKLHGPETWIHYQLKEKG